MMPNGPAVSEALYVARQHTLLTAQAVAAACPYYALDTLAAARRSLDAAERAIRDDLAQRATRT